MNPDYEREPRIGEAEEGPVDVTLEEEVIDGIKSELVLNDRDEVRDDLAPEEENISESSQPEETSPPKKKRSPLEKRLKELHFENKKKEEYIQELHHQNQELQHQAQESFRVSVVQYEDALEQRLHHSKQLIKQAKEEGDIDLEVDAQSEYQRLRRDREDLEALKASRGLTPTSRPSAPPIRSPEAVHEAPASLTPELQSWLSQNPFMNPDSHEFDSFLSEEVTAEDTRLATRYTRMGKEHLIGTAPYFDELNKYIKDNLGEDTLSAPPMKAPSNAVFSPRHTPQVPSKTGATIVRLSPEERAFAERLSLAHPSGRQYTKEESWAAYARNKDK